MVPLTMTEEGGGISRMRDKLVVLSEYKAQKSQPHGYVVTFWVTLAREEAEEAEALAMVLAATLELEEDVAAVEIDPEICCI